MSSSATSGISVTHRPRGTERGKGRGIPRKCRCGEGSIIRTSETTQNPGRLFYCCPFGYKEDKFHLFKWTDIAMVEEMKDLQVVVEKIEVDVGNLAEEMGTLACETRTCEAVVSSYGNEFQAIKVLVEGCEKEIEAVKAMVSNCEKEMHEFRSFTNVFVCGLVMVLAYYFILS